MSIEEIETEISAIYRAATAFEPGLTLKEEGRLGKLWQLADRAYAREEHPSYRP